MLARITKTVVAPWQDQVVEIVMKSEVESRPGHYRCLIVKPPINGHRTGDGSNSGYDKRLNSKTAWQSPNYSEEKHKAGAYWWIPLKSLTILPQNNEESLHLLKKGDPYD